ncbi:MAG: RecQ family ATP-dependent DNA helicase [Bacteroidales bacterium]|nr:RecQ family ATP-dependent DNA helicase [Bacteroidales bacterium]
MLETLKKYWGYERFRPMQEEIISEALAGRDVLAVLPTGGGKSVCFQVPALMRKGICIVVTPLIALMKDQVQNLRDRGIGALAVHAGMTRREIDYTLDNAIYGDYKFLYVSPERLRTELFRVRLLKMDVSLLAVDEAHCISQWGYDFRPDYLEIAAIRQLLGPAVPVMALTATATPQVAADIMDKLGFKKPNLLTGDFARPNLSYIFRETDDKMGRLLKVCRGVKGSGIVYVSRRKSAEDLAAFLRAQGESAECYHAGLPRESRARIQDAWKSGETRIIVSTNAFGMGIDKPDVRFVCHFDMPDSLEAYFQEAGRAGRDGQDAFAVLLWNRTDVRRLRQTVRTTYPPLETIRDIYQKVFIWLGFAYEEGKDASAKFELEKFAQRFRLHARTAYYAIKYLETAGYWTLTETLQIPAKIQFTVSRDELYRVQLGNDDTDAFVKLLLRMYTGLFTEYVPIDEEKIARAGRFAPAVVVEKLRSLSRRQILKYIPAIHAPMLNLHYERLDDRNLRLPRSEYDERVARRTDRLEALVNLVENDQECRCLQMYRYFGQAGGRPCGRCDVCARTAHAK